MTDAFRERFGPSADAVRRTPWTLISAAQKGERGAMEQAVEQIYTTFSAPVASYLRARGLAPEDARELAQEFFTTLLERKFVDRLDPSRGRLRHFLFASLGRFLCDWIDKRDAQKRQPEGRLVSLDRLAEEFRMSARDPRAPEPDRRFSKLWAADLLGRALARMKRECEGTSREGWYRAVVLWHQVAPGAAAASYADLARRLETNPQQAANFLFRGRGLLRTLLTDEIAATCGGERDVQEEIGDLFRALAE